MSEATANMLPDGIRLHLNHGPIDLVIEAQGADKAICSAYDAATRSFAGVLVGLVSELPYLRTEIPREGFPLVGTVARQMAAAVQPQWRSRVTPMAAVAGAVADYVLQAMVQEAPLRRAYVNNGGDIAVHLVGDEVFTIASPGGTIVIHGGDQVRGIATSGWSGRSFSLGIADSVTVLARTAAQADVAATLIGNAVDLPGSPKVKRQRANEIAPDNDLQDRLVTVGVDQLTDDETADALSRGLSEAERFVHAGQIEAASLMLGKRIFSTSAIMSLQGRAAHRRSHLGRGTEQRMHRMMNVSVA